MLARLRFRDRIVLLVVLAAAALVAVTLVTIVFGSRNREQVSSVETRYLPLLDLERELRATYALIPRALQDAASSGEPAGLARADTLVDELAYRIERGAAILRANGGDPDALVRDLHAYYETARSVSAALTSGDSPAALGESIDVMQKAQEKFAVELEQATSPDRVRLARAFGVARSSQRTALIVTILLAIATLAAMTAWSARIIRSTLRALREVSQGMERLGRGEFTHAIEIDTPDELGDLARDANRTAAQLVEVHGQLQRKAEELERASRYKSEFLANMSHELRTPLNSILVLSSLLGENEAQNLDAKQVEFARLIHRSGEELLAMINDVLDLSKIEAGKQDVTLASVSLGEVAAYARDMFEPQAQQKGLEYRVELGDGLPPAFVTDHKRLLQILKNLLANAFKFTERGGIRLRIARAGDDRIAFEVEDTGIGIAQDKRDLIFQAFAQADQGTARRYGGTGLGLNIARTLAGLLGGGITVESELDRGSTFRLELPLKTPAPEPASDEIREWPRPAEAPGDLPARAAALAGTSVVVADGDMRSLYTVANLLTSWHVNALTAADTRGALAEIARHREVDAILIDAALVAEDAGAVERLCAAAAGTPAVIVLGGDGARSLAKPVTPEQLVAALTELLA